MQLFSVLGFSQGAEVYFHSLGQTQNSALTVENILPGIFSALTFPTNISFSVQEMNEPSCS